MTEELAQCTAVITDLGYVKWQGLEFGGSRSARRRERGAGNWTPVLDFWVAFPWGEVCLVLLTSTQR